ncbi:hypothetical protein J6590_068746 [Homalodisca vitripennis]|nr:hypothetical protein J6590_068746 [Homalodisca vitripennis]
MSYFIPKLYLLRTFSRHVDPKKCTIAKCNCKTREKASNEAAAKGLLKVTVRLKEEEYSRPNPDMYRIENPKELFPHHYSKMRSRDTTKKEN